jgi:uncharacterized membrane protein
LPLSPSINSAARNAAGSFLEFAEIHGTVSAMPRFQLRSLLTFITFIAVAMCALVRPSVYWSIAMPAFAAVLCVFGVYRAFVSPRERPLWTSFIAGLFAYGASVMFVRPFFMYDGRWDVWQNSFGEPVWKLLHGGVPRTTIIINGNSFVEFASFVISLHCILAVLVSLTAAVVFQFCFAKHYHGS